MFRRSRLSIKPNVCAAGRTAGTPQEAPSSSKDSDEANPKTETPVSVTESKSVEPPPEQTPTPGDCNDQNEEGASSSAIQRRKRFSVKPKVVSGRPSALPRTPKSPIKPQSIKSPAPSRDKPATSAETNSTAPYQEVLSPKECKASDESTLSKIETVSPAEGSSKDVHLSVDTGKKLVTSCSQVKEVSPKALVPPSIPDREAIEISEKAKTLVSKTELRTTSQFSLSQLLNDKSDLLRMEKARKLRQLLKQEMHKEKTKKYKARVKEYSLDPAKMTMRDLIHYLPTSNPMLSTLEDSMQENETVIPQSPGREELPERAQEPEVQPKMLSPCPEETAAAAEEQETVEEEAAEDEEALMVPQVKVAEDGSLIIDEESLTVEVQRMKGPNPIQDRDPIFERGSTTTYSSFRKGTYAKPWSTEETDMFFLAISMVGTDFTMICQLFPHRARSEIKNKFKKEERYNAWRIDKAFRERRKLDLEYFTKLLEKILEFQQNKKKLKSMSEKNKSPKTRKRKTKSKQATYKLSDVEEENEISNEEEGEKENENLCNEKTSDSKPKTKRKRKDKDDLSPEQPVDKKKNKRKKKHVQDNSSASADSEEAALAEDHLHLDQSEKTETFEPTKNNEDKLEKPSLGKALLPLGRKGRKKTQTPKSKAIISDKEGESTNEEAVEEQIKKDLLPSQQSTKIVSDKDSSDQETTVQPTRPSRNGRVPRLVQPLNYPAKEDIPSSASESASASPAGHTSAAASKAKNKTTVKRGRSAHQKPAKESKKPKLITLRASQSECSDEEEDEENNALPCDDENSTSAFVPASLCSPKPVVPEVEETMEELDMLAHMPDVLGMSKNALCPDASCEQVQNERGTVEPCEHQLDLLVDVIDFLSEHTEASEDESYNEAAQTLLAIGNLTNLSQPSQDQPSILSPNVSQLETSQSSEIDSSSKSSVQQEQFSQVVSEPLKTETRPTDHTVEESPVSQTSDTQVIKPSDEQCSTQEAVSSPQINTTLKRNSSLPRKGRFSKIKPKPNIGCVSRTTKLSSQTVVTIEERQQVECDIATTSLPQSAELSTSAADSEAIFQESLSFNIQVTDSDQSETSGENQETSHLLNEPDPRTTDTASDNILISIEAVSELQTDHSSTTESISVCQDMVNQLEDIAVATPSILSGVISQDGKSNFPMEQTAEPERKNTQETHIEPPLEKSFIPSSEYPKPVDNIASPELEMIQSTHETPTAHSTDEEKNAKVELINESDSISESSKQSTPQRRWRFPKVKPKPNLVSSPRTTKSRVEGKDKSKPPDELGKCIFLNAMSEQQTLKRETLQTKPEEAEQFKSVNVEKNKVGTELVACCSELDTDTFKSSFQESDHPTVQFSHVVSLLNTNTKSTEEIAKLLHSDKISEDHNIIQQLSGTNQGNNESCQLTECASSDLSKSSETVCQPQDITLKATDVCLASGSSSTLQMAGSELCTEHLKPVEGAVEHLKELPHIDAGPHLALDQVQDTSMQNETTKETTFEYPSLLFPNMLSDQVPSDPDEPFFILSLTEIPVCLSGEVVDTRHEPHLPLPDSQAQQSNACEHTMALAAGIDDSLSNIHIPTPEKSALKTGLISVEEYLPSVPAVDISIVVEPQAEVDDNIQNDSTPPTKRQSSVRGDVDVKPSNRGQDLTRIAVVMEANRQTQTGTTQEPPDVSAQSETTESMGEIVENIETKENDVALFTGKINRETARNKRQNRKTLISSGPSCGQKSSQTPRQPEASSVNNTSISSSLQEDQSTSSTYQFPASHQSVSIGSSFLDDEPTTVSQYFFSDVFTEVESDGNSETGKINTDTACSDKTESQTAETRGNKRQNRKTEASSDLTCAQKSSQAERPEASVFNAAPPSNLQETPSTSSAIVPATNTNQQGTKGTRGKGNPSRKNKVSSEAKAKSSQLLKKSSAALKSPEALSPDSLKETSSTSSTAVQPQTHVANQQSSLQSTSEFPASHQSVSIGSSFLDEEPTTVSQYFFSDVFTEVESDGNSFTGKANQETACSDKTESQCAETRGNKGQNGKTKASSDASCGQKSSQTERPEASAANDEASSSGLQETPSTCTTVPTTDTSQQDTKRTRGKRSSSRKNKALDEAKAKSSWSQRKSSAALQSPEALSQDSLKETPSTSSTTVQPQTHVANQQSSLQSTSELLDSYQTDSVGSSFLDEEPTNVSQYFLSDVFTEVEEECKP